MSKVWSYEDACTLVGELYGNMLARDSDEAGFKYAVDQLSHGHESVRDIVRRFCTSEEFREKYIMNQTPNEFARRLLMRFSKDRRASPDSVKFFVVSFLEQDWRVAVLDVINGSSYNEAFGEDRPPVWV